VTHITEGQQDKIRIIESGKAVIGIELGSSRIKSVLIAPDSTPLASGSFTWENKLKDGIWTYDLDDVVPTPGKTSSRTVFGRMTSTMYGPESRPAIPL